MTAQARSTVLVVEDERALADLYGVWLGESYDVRTAYGGGEALAAIDDDVDVVLLDRRMTGTSGDEVLARIRDRGLDCLIAMVTAVEPDFDVVDMAFDAYLVKPVTQAELRRTIDRLVARSTYTDKVREYASLVARRTALEAEKTEAELASSEEFDALEARIEELRVTLDPLAREFDEEDVAAVLHDVAAVPEV